MASPFEQYLPFEQNGGVYVPQVFLPIVTIKAGGDGSIESLCDERSEHLLVPGDLRAMADSRIKVGNVQSFLHEGLLALMMACLLDEVAGGKKHGVLKVQQKDTAKEYVVDSNENYILKHKGRSNFVLLEKETTPIGRKRYQMEKGAYQATEIDGLGYLINESPHLIIGEASKGTEFKLNSWNNKKHKKDVFERVFTPLQELFADHRLVYMVFTRGQVIFAEGNRVTPRAENLYKKLKDINVDTLFVPTPPVEPSLEELAIRTHERLSIIRGQIGGRLL